MYAYENFMVGHVYLTLKGSLALYVLVNLSKKRTILLLFQITQGQTFVVTAKYKISKISKFQNF